MKKEIRENEDDKEWKDSVGLGWMLVDKRLVFCYLILKYELWSMFFFKKKKYELWSVWFYKIYIVCFWVFFIFVYVFIFLMI